MHVSIDPTWTVTCPGDTEPSVALFLGGRESDALGYSIRVSKGEQMELTLLDIGKGDVVLLVADSSYPDRFASLVDASHAIFDSMQFP